MTFATRLKEEICKEDLSRIEMMCELSAILRYDSKSVEDKFLLTFENGSVARRVFKHFKNIFNLTPHVIVRNQKRLRNKQIYLLEIPRHKDILESLNLNQKMTHSLLETPEEMVAFVRGTFLSCGSISDPSTSGYHLEFVFNEKQDAFFLNQLLHEMKFDTKVTERNNKYMVYLKSAEEISDMIRMFQASQSLFYFEDIRIYRDHKNMVNRLNNCDIANQEKTLTTGLKQIEDIHYCEEHDLLRLLDEKTQLVVKYRLKYPESSYQELSSIIQLEEGYSIGKSGINHHFIKLRKLVERHKNPSS